MDTHDAVALIESAVRGREGRWADLGAGHGTFTRALAEVLAPASRIYAVDRDPEAVAALERWASEHAPNVSALTADLAMAFDLAALVGATLDGMLVANALHFMRDAETVLARLVESVRPGGRIVLVEYDRREANRWIPYPVPIARLPSLAAAAGLSTFTVTASRPSAYQGILYVAAADRDAEPDAPTHDRPGT